MKKLITRSFTGILFVALILSAVIINIPPLYLLFILFSLLCAFESFKISNILTKDKIGFKVVAYLISIIYSFIPFFLLYQCAYLGNYNTNFQPEIIFGFFILLWSNDTGAYLIGTTIGKHLMAPKISPKKTWEGLIGGILISLLSAYILSRFYFIFNLEQWLIISLVISIPGIIGDLFESYLKRLANIKDSGNLLPGHGGFLDRFDALLFSAPIYYLFLRYLIF